MKTIEPIAMAFSALITVLVTLYGRKLVQSWVQKGLTELGRGAACIVLMSVVMGVNYALGAYFYRTWLPSFPRDWTVGSLAALAIVVAYRVFDSFYPDK